MFKSFVATPLGRVSLFVLMSATTFVSGFIVRSPLQKPFVNRCQLYAFDPTVVTSTLAESSSSLYLADATWRQYVSLALVVAVLVDILLGSPLANMMLKPMKDALPAEEGKDNDRAKAENRSKERIDSEQVAQAAIDRAQNALELRRFLDERKTDWDRMEGTFKIC